MLNNHFYEENRVIDFFRSNASIFSRDGVFTEAVASRLQEQCIDLLGIPDLFRKYGQKKPTPASLQFLSTMLWNASTTQLRKTLFDEGIEPVPRSAFNEPISLRVRLLSSYGSYPNARLTSEGFRYSFIGNRPILVTEEAGKESSSEVSSMNLNELIFSADVSLGPYFPRSSIHFVEG